MFADEQAVVKYTASYENTSLTVTLRFLLMAFSTKKQL